MFENKRHLIREAFECNKRTLLGYLTRRVGRGAAPDLLQETFVRFLQNSQNAAIADGPPFLQQIAINLALAVRQSRYLASAALIEALGGGWDDTLLPVSTALAHINPLIPSL